MLNFKLKKTGLIALGCTLGLMGQVVMAESTQNSGIKTEQVQTQKQKAEAKELYKQSKQLLQGKPTKFEQAQSVQLLEQSASMGYAPAQDELGLMYYAGFLAKQDNMLALQWFKKAAEQGYAQAQYHVGQMYTEGKGVKESEIEAAKWYEKSAEQGYAPAQSYLGILYLFGVGGIEKNQEKAMSLLEKAAKQGDKEAKNLLSKLKK